MKVIAINGSPKPEGNTYHAIRAVFGELEAAGIETEILHVGADLIHGCTGCGKCIKNKDEECIFKNDPVNPAIQKMKEADGLILASPVYYSGIAGTMKCFLDRTFYVANYNNQLFRHKVGASLAVVRRSGGVPTFDQLNHYLLYSEMIIPTSSYWNVSHGRLPGEVLRDEEGIETLKMLGRNMVWALKMREQAGDGPEPSPKVFTHFIRD